MNLQLYIEDLEIELNEEVELVLNKRFDDFQNPTNIVNDNSLSLNIPFTDCNHKVFGGLFNVERRAIAGEVNIGMSYNPNYKASFRLMYNGNIIMSGYIKMLYVDNVDRSYVCELYGEVGNTITELQKCTFDNEDAKYKIPNYLQSTVLTKELVRDSWLNDSPRLSLDDEDIQDTDIVGFMPTERGLPDNFQPDTILDANGEFIKMSDVLNELRQINYGDSLIKKGLTERQWGQYRTWNQKPYVYVNKLWQMMEKKSKEICEYPLRLDKFWFNKDNPYYSQLIYTFGDYDKTENKTSIESTGGSTLVSDRLCKMMIESTTGGDNHIFTVYTSVTTKYQSVKFMKNACLSVKIYNEDGVTVADYIYNNGESGAYTAGYPASLVKTIQYLNWSTEEGRYFYNVVVPIAGGGFHEGDRYTCEFKYLVDSDDTYSKRIVYDCLFGMYIRYLKQEWGATIQPRFAKPIISALSVSLDALWNPEIKPMDVLINYAKMYGLVFITNRKDKCIDVTCRNMYFDNYSIEDWSDKVDTSNVFTIKQPTFEARNILFDYDDVSADNYTDYKDRFDVNIGAKKIITDYEFNDDDENMFEGIKPTNVVNMKITGRKQLFEQWQPGYAIPSVECTEIVLDNRNDDKSANISSSFAFRRLNQPVDTRVTDVYITEDSIEEISAESYCYHSYIDAYSQYRIKMDVMPYISIIDNSGLYGCLYDMPNEYYFNKEIMPYENALFVYDAFWRDYINERYDKDNKVVTLEVKMNPYEYSNFKFNRFVKIENTLYMVNAIEDYQIGNNPYTKVELITVKNLDAYKAGKKFEYSYFTVNRIDTDTDNLVVKVNVKSNTDWTLFTPARGAATFDKSSGTGDAEITITLQELRDGVEARVIPVNILNLKGDVTDVLKITLARKSE